MKASTHKVAVTFLLPAPVMLWLYDCWASWKCSFYDSIWINLGGFILVELSGWSQLNKQELETAECINWDKKLSSSLSQLPLNFELNIFSCGVLTFNWYLLCLVWVSFSSVSRQLKIPHQVFGWRAPHQSFHLVLFHLMCCHCGLI